MKARERHELEAVAQVGELFLEARDGATIELGAPIERGRAIVGEELARVAAMHLRGEFPRFAEIGLATSPTRGGPHKARS